MTIFIKNYRNDFLNKLNFHRKQIFFNQKKNFFIKNDISIKQLSFQLSNIELTLQNRKKMTNWLKNQTVQKKVLSAFEQNNELLWRKTIILESLARNLTIHTIDENKRLHKLIEKNFYQYLPTVFGSLLIEKMISISDNKNEFEFWGQMLSKSFKIFNDGYGDNKAIYVYKSFLRKVPEAQQYLEYEKIFNVDAICTSNGSSFFKLSFDKMADTEKIKAVDFLCKNIVKIGNSKNGKYVITHVLNMNFKEFTDILAKNIIDNFEKILFDKDGILIVESLLSHRFYDIEAKIMKNFEKIFSGKKLSLGEIAAILITKKKSFCENICKSNDNKPVIFLKHLNENSLNNFIQNLTVSTKEKMFRNFLKSLENIDTLILDENKVIKKLFKYSDEFKLYLDNNKNSKIEKSLKSLKMGDNKSI
ncbi:hypothetical protein MHBO_002820 [Bonamia ostreae]|uniref:Uncharacterized protein n=1 Tax=Bonamia ostreae TaxID=126728 RepID=A0ABV2ANM4_9EUKA